MASAIVHEPFFPTFTRGVSSAWAILTQGGFSTDVLPSIERVLVGFGIAAVLGALVGAVLGSSPRLASFCTPVLDFIRATPFPLLLPLAIVRATVSTRSPGGQRHGDPLMPERIEELRRQVPTGCIVLGEEDRGT